jgi:hypothetical protein
MAKREEINEGKEGSGEEDTGGTVTFSNCVCGTPLVHYKQGSTFNLGDFNSVRTDLGFSNIRAAQVDADLAVCVEAAPKVIAAVDNVHGELMSGAFGTAVADDIHAGVIRSFVTALKEAKGKK